MTVTSILPRLPVATATWAEAVRSDLEQVEHKMSVAAHMGDSRLDPAISALITAGGKRMRPAITVLMGRMFDVLPAYVHAVGASIELLHTATLVHDDLIDGSPERRGTPTLHSRLPMGITVLTGDFMFAQSAALAAEANSVRVVQLFADTLVRICKGEILQAQTRWQLPTEAVYEERIYGKTAALFEAASTAAAILGNAAESVIETTARYGRALGLGFQIVDDALDFLGTSEQLGKPAGHDMRNGIFNLPALFYVRDGHISAEELLHRVEQDKDVDGLVADIRASDAVEQSLAVAREHGRWASEALAELPKGKGLAELRELTENALARAY